MTPARLQKIDELFQAAVACLPNERSVFLNGACAGDESLRIEIEALLAADSDAPDFEEMTKALAANWAAASDHHDLIGQTCGHYKIIAPLAAGGMGEVFVAEDVTLKRKAAIKFLPRRFTRAGDRLRRFEQEARAASALNHPNIITIYEIGEWNGTHFIASELIEGETLPTHLPLAQVLDIGCQAAGALAAAHEAGIVHRDIKPANIMLRKDGYIKVLDFGLAKLTGTGADLDATEPGRVMGTVNYMSPEQALAKPLDHRTDIFSLGVVLYEIATGRRLFGGQSEAATYDCILNQEPPPMREIDSALPEEFELVVRRALEKNPERRYQSAADLRTDLKRLSSGSEQTEAAKIARSRDRAARIRRNSRFSAAAALIVTLAALVFFGGQRSAVRPNEISRKSIAVLPFENLNHDEENASFTDGVQDQILTNLTKIADLKVISRTSVQEFKPAAARNRREIAQQLRVAYLLQGDVQRANEKMRVHAQLIDAKSDTPVWTQTFDHDVADVFVIQSEIAKKIANQLRAKLSPAERAEIERQPTSDLGAFALYARGKTMVDLASTGEDAEPNFRGGIDLLNQAVERDPTFFVAWCNLAHAQDTLILFGFDNTRTRHAMAQAAVDAARGLSPDSGDTHLVAAMHFYAGLDYDRAREELEAARRSLPNDPRTFELSGYINRRQNHWEESTRDLERVVEVDPLNVDVLQQLASNYDALHRYEQWAATLDRIIELRPERIGPRVARGVVDQWWRADTRRMHAALDAWIREDPASAKTLADQRLQLAFFERDFVGIANCLALLGERRYGMDWEHFSRAFGQGLLARMTGDAAAARIAFAADRIAQERIVQAQPDYAPAISMLGLIEAGLGHKEEALRLGGRAVELLPTSKDSIRGPHMVSHLAIIAAWLGEKDLAIEQLGKFKEQMPVGPHYGQLKLDPMWDPLRGDPRFEAIVASLAPNESR